MIVFAVFLALAALCLAAMLANQLSWKVKAIVIPLTAVFAFGLWSSIDSYKGWAVQGAPFPNAAQFVSCVVNEPAGDKGSIFLWVIPLRHERGLLSYRSSQFEPRAYREPYSESLNAACQSAAKKSANGAPVAIGQKRRSRGGTTSDPGRFHAYRLPTPHPPTKRSPQ